VAYDRLKDSDAAAGRLKPYPMAIFPYSFVWPKPVVAAVKDYVASGGKALFFYSLPDELAALIGVTKGGWKSPEPRPYYQTIVLRQDLLIPGGLPKTVRQNSHNIYPVQPAMEAADVFGEWAGPDGKPLGIPALVVTKRGAFMGHVLTSGDSERKGRMLRAVIGLLVPEVWERAWQRALADAEQVGPLESFDALAERIEAARVSRSDRRQAQAKLEEARQRLTQARAAGEEGTGADAAREMLRARGPRCAAEVDALGDSPQVRAFLRSFLFADALNDVAVAREAAAEAFARSSPERLNEFRGIWIHTAYGVGDWGWRKSIRHLADQGFNAILPNMLWGGLAHYPSKVLPVAPDVKEKGDQIAECLKWCKEYDIELHVWKVNWNLGRAPKEFIEQLRTEGRLQHDRSGKELQIHGRSWLCPSDPRNFLLERESLIEVVRNYDVDGIHFDYIRYPGTRGCYCNGCRERFEKTAKVTVEQWPQDVLNGPLKDRFATWRQHQITRLVAAVAEEARQVRPDILISAAVFRNWERHRFSVGQDWKLWVEKGWLDFVCPMDYTTSADDLEEIVAKQVGWVDGRVPLYPGIGAWRLPGAPALLDQLERARRVGADGFTCFHYNDRTFTDERMPMLHLSHTAHRTRPPHRAPEVRFELPPAAPELPGHAYHAGTELACTVTLRPSGNYAEEIESAYGRLHVETTEGEEVRRLAYVRGDEPRTVTLRLPAGRYRLALRGRVTFGWFSGHDYVVRSRPFDVVGKAAAAAEAAKRQPPQFRGPGLRVGMVTGGYGSQAILTALQRHAEIEARPLLEVTPEYLQPCQVVVVPQPREGILDEEEVAALRQFVARGGGLLATHDAPGFREHPVLLPEVCPGGEARIEGTRWWATAEHPVTRDFTMEKPLRHSYYDFIALRVGPEGTAVAKGFRAGEGSGPSAGPVVVCGQHGKGRYVACGLTLGINKEDEDTAPTGPELALLLNTLRWLGRR
jgi:uncharacterized lipoprotein YddW (UPF0748 family)